jgi:hypothetical protein
LGNNDARVLVVILRPKIVKFGGGGPRLRFAAGLVVKDVVGGNVIVVVVLPVLLVLAGI